MIENKHIFIKNIYYMLSYAFQSIKQKAYEDISTEEFDHIHNLFASTLAKGTSLQIKQGLYKEYKNYHEDLKVVRGKIDINSTIANRIKHNNSITCEYDELSEDNLYNQIIKSTVLLLIKHGEVEEKYKNELKKEMLYFTHVSSIDLSLVRWSDIRFHRNNQCYRMLISICQLIVQGMLLTDDKGNYRLATFIDEQDMCRLYEKFILEYYKQTYPSLSVKASQIPWSLDDGMSTMLPIMQSDITIRKGNQVLIIDAKYYGKNTQTNYNVNTVISGNLYQIFTYVKNYDYSLEDKEHTVSGMLLYAKTNQQIQPDASYMMHGNKIEVKTLDLNKEFKEIAKQLDDVIIQRFIF